MQHLLGALLQDHRRGAHPREQQQEGDQHRRLQVEDHDPGEEGGGGDQRGGGGGRVGETGLVTKEFHLVPRRRRRCRPIFGDETALQALGRGEFQGPQEHQRSIGHAGLRLDDRDPQAPRPPQVAVADQRRAERAGQRQTARQRRQDEGEDAVAAEHDQGDRRAHRRIGRVADLLKFDAQGLHDPGMLEPDHVLPRSCGELLDEIHADLFDKFQTQPIDGAVACGQDQAAGGHQSRENGEQDEQAAGLAVALKRQGQRLQERSARQGPAGGRGDHLQDRNQEEQPHPLEEGAQGDQEPRDQGPPAGEAHEGRQEGERARTDA